MVRGAQNRLSKTLSQDSNASAEGIFENMNAITAECLVEVLGKLSIRSNKGQSLIPEVVSMISMCKWEQEKVEADSKVSVSLTELKEWLCCLDSYRDLQRKTQVYTVYIYL